MEAQPSPFNLHGRVAVVTGGNRGIGFGIAQGLARAGASISIWARDPVTSANAAAELTKIGAEVQTVSCDVSSEDQVVEATDTTLKHFGQIDVGIANAGFGRVTDPLVASLAEFQEVLDTNLNGVFLTFRELGRHMKERGKGGKLIAISSISAQSGTPMQPHYAASKGGVEGDAAAGARTEVRRMWEAQSL